MSSKESIASQNLKRNSGDVGWDYAILVDKNNVQRVRCTLCSKILSGGIHRLKQHIAGVKGNVASCTKANKEDIARCKSALDGLSSKKKAKQDRDVAMRREVRIDEDEMEESFGEFNSQRSFGPMDQFTSSEKGKSKQTDLNSVMKKEKADRLNEYVARWAYENAIPFNAIEKDSFNAMLEAAGDFGRGAKGPTRYQLGECLLNKEIERTKCRMKKYEDEWKKHGCSIMTDAWTDKKRRSIMNLCVNSKSGTVFLSSKESSNEAHTKEHIYEYVESCIKHVGPENIVQVVTDNASNNMGASRLLKEKRPTIFWTSCAAHTINLMLEAIGEIKTYKETIDKSRKITKFLYAHHKTLAIMRQYTENKEIIRPGVTRFASSFLTLESLREKKVELRKMIMSKEWEECPSSITTKGKVIRGLIIDDKTWSGVNRCLIVFEPLVKILRMVDADWKPSMGFLHGELKKAIQQVKDVSNGNKDVMKIISKKMEGRLDSCLHLAAYVLNPFYYYNDISIEHDNKANDAVIQVVSTLYPDDFELQELILNEELPKYKDKQGTFSRVLAIKNCEVNDHKYFPATWWSNYGNETPNLRTLAMRILSLTTSSSGCERNWSTFEAIHTKKRNRLGAKKLNDLVYVQFNANLLDKNERRKERIARDVLLSNDDCEAQDWFMDEELTYEVIGNAMGVDEVVEPRRSNRTSLLDEDFESESEEVEVDEDQNEHANHIDISE